MDYTDKKTILLEEISREFSNGFVLRGKIYRIETANSIQFGYTLSHWSKLSESGGVYIPSNLIYPNLKTAAALLKAYMEVFNPESVLANENYQSSSI